MIYFGFVYGNFDPRITAENHVEKRPAAWLWVVALLPTLWVGAVRWNAGQGMGAEDYAGFTLHARALVEGRPYGDIGYIYSTYNPGHGPRLMQPGLPLYLAGLWTVVGEHDGSTKAAMYLLSLAFFVVAGRYFVRDDPWLALGVTMLAGLAPIVVRSSPLIQSDLPFCLSVWLLLWLADRPGAWSWWRVAGITAAGLAAVAFRIVGVVLVPAVLLVSLWRWKDLRWRGLVPPLIWTAMLTTAGVVVGLPRLARTSGGWIGLSQFLHAFQRNNFTYRMAIGDGITRPFPWELAVDVYQMAALVPLAIGAFLWLRGAGRRYAVGFAVLYGVMLLILPFGERRYLWVLFPLLLFSLLRGVALLAEKLRLPLSPRAVALAFAAVIALCAAATTARSPVWGSLPTNPQGRELLTALRTMNAEHPVRAVFSRTHLLTLETGIPAMPLFRADPDTMEAELQRHCMTHVVVTYTDMEPRLDSLMREFVASRPAHFEPVFRNALFAAYRYTALRPEDCPSTIRRPGAAQ